MTDDLRALETWAEPLLQQMSAGERTKLARSIGTVLRRANHERIQAQRNPDGSPYLPRKRLRDKAGRIKRTAARMFRRISQADYLRVQADPNGVAIGFTGRVARIAGVHQRGESDEVSRGGPSVRYPIRELLGVTAEDRATVRDMILDHIGGR